MEMVKVELSTGQEVEITKLLLGEVPKVATFIKSVVQADEGFRDAIRESMESEGEANKGAWFDVGMKIIEVLPKIVTESWDDLLEIVQVVAGLDEEEVNALNLQDDFTKILKAFFQVNDFNALFSSLKNVKGSVAKAVAEPKASPTG